MIYKNRVTLFTIFCTIQFFHTVPQNKEKQLNQLIAIIPAAGFGTRFLPFTKTVPKELVPINGRPSIEYVIEECVANNIFDICIISNKDKIALHDYFTHDTPLDHFLKAKHKESLLKSHYDLLSQVTISFVEQAEQKGLGHAVLCAHEKVKNKPCAVILPDEIITPACALFEMQKLAQKYQATVIAVQTVEKEKVSSYGIVKIGNQINDHAWHIADIIEKPSIENAPSQLAVIGRYILQSTIFESLQIIKPGLSGELQLTDAIADALHKNHPVIAYEYTGNRFDVGNPEGFLKANNFFTHI
jgi:UTP--glucose-1-phosphate uridylyltransferase